MNWALKSRLYGYKCTNQGKMWKKPESLWTNVCDRMGFTFAWPITIFFLNVSQVKRFSCFLSEKCTKKMEAKLRKDERAHLTLFFACRLLFRVFLIGLNNCYLSTFHNYLLGHFKAIHTHYKHQTYSLPCILLPRLFVKYSCDSLKDSKYKMENNDNGTKTNLYRL